MNGNIVIVTCIVNGMIGSGCETRIRTDYFQSQWGY